MHGESEVGQVLDDWFELTDVISRSGMASIYKAHDLLPERPEPWRSKVPFMQFESDLAFFLRFEREEEIAGCRPSLYTACCPGRGKSRPISRWNYSRADLLRELMRVWGA